MPREPYDVEWHANELELFAVNTGEIYPARKRYEQEAVAILNDTTDPATVHPRIRRMFRSWLIFHAIPRYYSEVDEPSGKAWRQRTRFSAEAITNAAESVTDTVITEWQLGNL